MWRPKMVHLIGLAVSVLVSACGSGETSLRTMTPTNDERSKLRPVSPSSVEEQGGSLAPPVWKKVELNQRAASFLVEEGSDHTSVQESFWVGDGATTGMADYLFVVDDSVSMANIIESFSRGFERLSASDVFPVNARVAVMNMTPANPSNLRRRHPVVPSRAGVEQSPGFIHLIDADRIKAYNTFWQTLERTRFDTTAVEIGSGRRNEPARGVLFVGTYPAWASSIRGRSWPNGLRSTPRAPTASSVVSRGGGCERDHGLGHP